MTRETEDQVWHVPLRVDDVPEAGRHVVLDADARVRAAVAQRAGVVSVPRLHATFEVSRKGRTGLRVTGEVRGRVEQTCVVSLEPMETDIVEPVDVVYAPPSPDAPPTTRDAAKAPIDVPNLLEEDDPPEPLIDGIADLGALATEFLILGIDPYPRKPDATLDIPATDTGSSGPFAALAKLKRGDDDRK